MAGKRQRANGTWEYKFQRKNLMDRPVHMTFDDEVEGDEFAARAEEMLNRGFIPMEFQGVALNTLGELIDRYCLKTTSNPDLDQRGTVMRRVGTTRLEKLSYPWCERWVESMRVEGLAPSTITKNVGMLARCVDWALRSGIVNMPNNPLRLLPCGYASKGRLKSTWEGERDRRLSADGAEEGAIRRALSKNGEHAMMFDIALETAMRLSEIYTLTKAQVDLLRSTIFLVNTKNGSRRQVPVTSVLAPLLARYMASLPETETRLFPRSWGGKRERALMAATTNALSKAFTARFRAAGVNGLRFHDLRHEATSRIYERTSLSDVQVARITGHRDPRMLRRYANLRASDLAASLW